MASLHSISFAAIGLCLCFVHQTLAENTRDIDNSINALPAQMSSSGDMSPAILDRLTALDRRVEELQEQNRQLMNELLRLSANAGKNKVLQDLRGVCEELTGGSPTGIPGRQTTTTEAPTPPSVLSKCPKRPAASQLQITALFTEQTDSQYKVTVCYVSPEKPQISYRVSQYGDSQKVENHDFGVVVLETNKPKNNESGYLDVDFTLFQSEYHISMKLELNEDSPKEVYPDILQVTVDPGNKIIYRPGSDVDILLDIVKEGKSSGYNYNVTQLFMKSNTESNTVDRFVLVPDMELPPDFVFPDYIENIDYTQTIHSEENTTVRLHMPYSPRRAAGIIIFQMIDKTYCSQGCLVDLLIVSQRIVFYPQGEPGPFPQGFVGFAKDAGPHERNRDERQCYEDNRRTNCVLFCSAMGDDPQVTLRRADNAPVSPHSENSYDEAGFVASSFWEFENPRQEDSGDYLCQARSRDGGHVISKTLAINVGKVAELVPALTSARAFPNGTLTAVCTATGRPTPTLHFSSYGSESSSFLDEADISPNTTLDSSTVQITLISPNWKNYDRYDVFDSFYCCSSNAEYYEDCRPMEVEEVE